jgi:hypothetical protein
VLLVPGLVAWATSGQGFPRWVLAWLLSKVQPGPDEPLELLAGLARQGPAAAIWYLIIAAVCGHAVVWFVAFLGGALISNTLLISMLALDENRPCRRRRRRPLDGTSARSGSCALTPGRAIAGQINEPRSPATHDWAIHSHYGRRGAVPALQRDPQGLGEFWLDEWSLVGEPSRRPRRPSRRSIGRGVRLRRWSDASGRIGPSSRRRSVGQAPGLGPES